MARLYIIDPQPIVCGLTMFNVCLGVFIVINRTITAIIALNINANRLSLWFLPRRRVAS